MASARHGMAMNLNREYDVKNYKFIIIIVLSVFVGQFGFSILKLLFLAYVRTYISPADEVTMTLNIRRE